MTRGKKLLVLLGVLAAVVILSVIILRVVNNQSNSGESYGHSILQVDEDSVTQIQWTYEGQTMTFNKEGDTWTYADDAAFPVNADYLDTMVTQLKSVYAYKTIEDVTDTAQYGLDDPQVTVKVNDGEDHTLVIGDLNALEENVYVSIGDGNVYLANTTLGDNFEYSLLDVAAKESVPDMDTVTSFSISGTGEVTAVYNENGGDIYSSTYVWFSEDNGTEVALDTENTEDIVSDIKAITFNTCAAYAPSDEELSQFGLADPAGTITMNYTDADGNTGAFTIYVGSATEDSAYYYAMTGAKDRVYTISSSVAESIINTNLESLLPDDVIKMDWDTVESIDVTVDGKTFTLKRKSEDSGETDDDGNAIETSVWKLNGETVDIGSYLTQLNSLSGTRTNGLTEGDEYVKFEIHRSTDTYSDMTLVFGIYSDDNYTVTLDGSTNILIDKDSADNVLQNIIDAIDPE